MSSWALPDDLVVSLSSAARISDPSNPSEVALALAAWLPCGSSAKLAAVATGSTPPGADPAAIVSAALAGRSESWSCWAIAGVTAALLSAAGCPSTVALCRRVDPDAVPVDFHAVVATTSPAGLIVTDPYFASGPVALSGGRSDPTRLARLTVEPGRHPLLRVEPCPGRPGRYRWIGLVTPDDVEAFCVVSTTHSGVPPRRDAKRTGVTTAARISEDDDGSSRLTLVEIDPRDSRTTWRGRAPSWPDAFDWLLHLDSTA